MADGDCDDADASIYPGAPETWGVGIDQDCDGVADSAVSTCSASFLLTFPDGSSIPLDTCDRVALSPDYDYADDAPPEIIGLVVTLQSSTADCSVSFVQDGICGPGTYDQAGATTVTTIDCVDAPAEWSAIRRDARPRRGRVAMLPAGLRLTPLGAVAGAPG